MGKRLRGLSARLMLEGPFLAVVQPIKSVLRYSVLLARWHERVDDLRQSVP